MTRIYVVNNHNIFFAGTIKEDTFNRDRFFDLCNWSCWTEEKPATLDSIIASCGSGIVFLNQETNEYHLTLPFGWFSGSKDELITFLNGKGKNIDAMFAIGFEERG